MQPPGLTAESFNRTRDGNGSDAASCRSAHGSRDRGHPRLAFADRTDFLNVRADALLAYASAARSRSDAADAVAAAIRLYERKGNLVSAEAARSIVSSAQSWSATR